MKSKKIVMIALLIVFIIIIGIAIANINNKSVEKLSEVSQTANNSSDTEEKVSSTNASSSTIRKSSEKVEADVNNIVEIKDNYFIESTNDVYVNLEDYIGKTIKMQGLIYSYQDNNGDFCYAVVRNTPGCCGSDGLAGLDIRYDGDYPKENTWVEVEGVVGKDIVFGSEIPAIQVTSLKETEKGITFVTN